ncbi:dienelactone hydrolase family protein [Edaphobacter bradus]|uniref:dienelactone hydrolase family protein n=1 Tax=Edaphobacter bradus TaxID=2259016 RepID=UPI0021DFB006|nr:dienelactone hydrolase family protein [Edaphobacter bradus]
MTEQALQLKMPGGNADAVLFLPGSSGPLPGIVHIPDIGSIRESQRAMARRLAAEGYVVLMPNPFYRTSRPPVFPFERKPGDAKTMERMKELIAPLTPEAQEQDIAAYVDYLASQTSVLPNKIGVVGFCFGGGCALRTAAVRPEKVRAAASFHGGGLYEENDPASPHLVLPKVKARLYFGHADKDQLMPADAITHFEQALNSWGGKYESETYRGAFHGWTVPDSASYNKPEAERAYGKMTELFKAALS